MRVLIIGATTRTAGIGGVSIHVERLLEALASKKFKYAHVDYKESAILSFIKCIKADVIHIHAQNKAYSFLLSLWAKIVNTKVIYTLHQKYSSGYSIDTLFCNWMFRLCDVIITLNTQSKKAIKQKLGIDTVLLPAFIPPHKSEPLDDCIQELIKKSKQNGRKLCVTNAAFYHVKASEETYGISFLVKFFEVHPEFYLIVSDPSGQNSANIHSEADNIAFVPYPHCYYEILKHADISIRNTNEDGDALSVKESLSLGVKTLCTDVVDRPEGALLFKYGDEGSLLDVLFKSSTQCKTQISFTDPVDSLINIYEELCKLS